MNFSERIQDDMKQAMRAKDQAKLRTLRAIKSEILVAQTSKGGQKDLDQDAAMQILQRMAKQRKESLEMYQQQGREDLAQSEQEELEVIESYLPRQMSEEEVRKEVREIIEETGASGTSDLGKVMPVAMQRLRGQADGKVVNQIVREELER